jgi:hypothetical protein
VSWIEGVVCFRYRHDDEHEHPKDDDRIGHLIDAYLEPEPDDRFTLVSYWIRPDEPQPVSEHHVEESRRQGEPEESREERRARRDRRVIVTTPDEDGSTTVDEPLEDQTERLANFIVEHVPGEPSANEGAIDTALRLLRRHYPVRRASTYRTRDGRELIDAEIQELAVEAERGYDVDELKERDR